jgi:thimet oligopeptidase
MSSPNYKPNFSMNCKLIGVISLIALTACSTPSGREVPTSKQAGNYQQQCATTQTNLLAKIKALETVSPPLTVATVLSPLNDIEIGLADALSESSLYENVHPDPDLRQAAADCTASLAALATQLSLSRPIYDAVKSVDSSGEAADTQRYHFTTLRGFRLSGVDKDQQTRDRLQALNDEITRLGQEFSKNILEDVRYLEVHPSELEGLPEDFIESRERNDEGKIRLSTRYVDTIPVYTYAASDNLRRQLRELDRSRGYPQNAEVLKRMLAARHELANLLGFDNFADFITADKMIGNLANARDFIDRIHDLAKPVAENDMAVLLAQLKTIDPEARQVERWQASYLEEMLRRDQYQVDASAVRQYFPYINVKNGIFDLVSRLFGVTIKPWKTDVWHPSVEAYELFQDDKLIARFYLDMHPREGKYQHAAAFTNQIGIEGRQLPVSTLVCNFVGGADPTEPMEFGEVRTFLHEFGHLLHAMFGGHQRWASLSGIATEWDFAEAPSQMLEEWMYDTETLQSFAVNAAGEVIPDTLIKRLREARDLGQGMTTNVQMYYSALSLEFHSEDPENFDLTEKMVALENHYSPMPHQENTYFYANLGHLYGYSAIYYTYMWSKVIALDMFSEFEKNGLNDSVTATRYRESILQPGGSKPAAQLVKDFLGREYTYEAFSQRLQNR